MKKWYLIALVGFVLGSCDNRHVRPYTFELGTPFIITHGQTAECTCGDLSVTLDHIDESRCPALVECFWAGFVSVDLHLNGAPVKLGFNCIDTTPQRDTLWNYVIELQDVSPYPQMPGDLEQADYTVTLKVTEVE